MSEGNLTRQCGSIRMSEVNLTEELYCRWVVRERRVGRRKVQGSRKRDGQRMKPPRDIRNPDLPASDGADNSTDSAEMGISEASLPDVAASPSFSEMFGEALAFLDEVTITLMEIDRDKADQISVLLKNHAAGRIDPPQVMARASELLTDHWVLVAGLNLCVVEDQNIPDSIPNKYYVERICYRFVYYINKIRMRFQREEHVFKTFLEILSMYTKGNKSDTEVCQEIRQLFKAQHADDLVEDFVDIYLWLHFPTSERLEFIKRTCPDAGGDETGTVKPYTSGKERIEDGAQAKGMPSSNLETDERKEREKNNDKKDRLELDERLKAMTAAIQDHEEDMDLDYSLRLALLEDDIDGILNAGRTRPHLF